MSAQSNRREFLRRTAMVAAGLTLAACGATPTATPIPPTATPVPATATPVPPAATKAPAAAATSAPATATKAPAAAAPTAAPAPKYKEAPMLAELVKQGKLPPVEQRLPKSPRVVKCLPEEFLKLETGKYGGTLRLVGPAVQYDADQFMMCRTPAVETPGMLGDEFIPNLLERFEANADQTVFTLTLREGLKWSDGHPVTTKDIQFTIDDIWLNKELNAGGPDVALRAGAKASGGHVKLEVVNDYTCRMIFPTPYGSFPLALSIYKWKAHGLILRPRHYMEQFHKKYADPAKLDALIKANKFETWVQLFTLMNGDVRGMEVMRVRDINAPKLTPWLLKEGSDQRCVLERNPYYFKVDTAGQQLPYIDRMDFTTVPDLEVIALKQFAGEADYGAETVTMPKLGLYKENETKGGYRIAFGNIHRTSGCFGLNLTYKDDAWRKVVRDVRFRKALSMAVNRKELIDAVYYGYGEPYPLNPQYDLEGAKKLLDEMGMNKKGSDGYRLDPDGNPFVIDISVNPDYYDLPMAGDLYVQYFKAVGINTTIKRVAPALLSQQQGANQLKANITWPTSPVLWHYQDYRENDWAKLWWTWWSSNGKDGEEPPEEVKAFYKKTETAFEKPPAEAKKVFTEQNKAFASDFVYFLIPTLNQKQPRLENKKLANMTSHPLCFSIAQTVAMEQAYFKE